MNKKAILQQAQVLKKEKKSKLLLEVWQAIMGLFSKLLEILLQFYAKIRS